MNSRSLNQRTALRLVPQPPFLPAEECRKYGPNEVPHPFAVSEMVVRVNGRVVKVLHLRRGEWTEVAS